MYAEEHRSAMERFRSFPEATIHIGLLEICVMTILTLTCGQAAPIYTQDWQDLRRANDRKNALYFQNKTPHVGFNIALRNRYTLHRASEEIQPRTRRGLEVKKHIVFKCITAERSGHRKNHL